MKEEYLNKKVRVTCIDGQVLIGTLTEWEKNYIDINSSTEILLDEVERIELI